MRQPATQVIEAMTATQEFANDQESPAGAEHPRGHGHGAELLVSPVRHHGPLGMARCPRIDRLLGVVQIVNSRSVGDSTTFSSVITFLFRVA